jgi:hypothetical protein
MALFKRDESWAFSTLEGAERKLVWSSTCVWCDHDLQGGIAVTMSVHVLPVRAMHDNQFRSCRPRSLLI